VDFATAEALCLHGGVPAKRKNPTIGRVQSKGLGAYQEDLVMPGSSPL